MFERALLFLSNPQKIWDKGSFVERRTVLKLTFLDNLAYTRNEGFRTPKTSIPFKVLDDISTHKSNMVRSRRLELPREINPTATSTLRVYQFRHDRTVIGKRYYRPKVGASH